MQQVNKNGANALGYKAEDMLKKHFIDFVEDEQKDEISKAFQKMLSNKSTVHFEINFLHKLDKSITNFKADFNVNYRIKDFSLNGMITIGSFTNLNLGINYNIN